MLRPHKDEQNEAVTMLFAGCTQQEVVSALGVNQINVRQLHVRLHQLDSTDYTSRTGCKRVTILGQDRQIRLPHLRSHFTTVVETATTNAGQGNQCVSAQTVRNVLWGAVLCTRLRTFELLLWMFHLSISAIWFCNVQDNAKPRVARVYSDFLPTNKVHVLRWSAFSPNLNPIECLWDELDKRV
jgi:hypothetical protein